MKRVAQIGGLLKKIYRIYANELLVSLQSKGFLDLRPSFLEILIYICDSKQSSIKEIGAACGLKKQTMTSHLNELESRGYIIRNKGESDRRELKVALTPFGEKFKLALLEATNDLETSFSERLGDVEMDRILMTLNNFMQNIEQSDNQQAMLL